MTEIDLPAELTGLPAPWNLSSGRARRDLLAHSRADAAAVQEALVTLDRALATLPRLADPPDDALPGDLAEYFDFTAEWLAKAMPTLDDLSCDTIAALLQRDRPTEEPDTGEIRALAEYWLRYTTVDIIWSALHWLDGQRLGDAAAVDQLLAVVGRGLTEQPKGMRRSLLTTAAGIARRRARSLLAAVAADDRADPELREHAMSLQSWLSGLPADPVE